ncbi:MAG: hypothetical protein R3C15_06865 [Thermoleophilia bacterium]
MKRWPKVEPPEGTSSSATSIVSASSLTQSQRMGRERMPPATHCIGLPNAIPRTSSATRSGSESRIDWPGTTPQT